MSLKKYIPSGVQAVQVTIVVVILAVTGIGAALIAKAKQFSGRR